MDIYVTVVLIFLLFIVLYLCYVTYCYVHKTCVSQMLWESFSFIIGFCNAVIVTAPFMGKLKQNKSQ